MGVLTSRLKHDVPNLLPRWYKTPTRKTPENLEGEFAFRIKVHTTEAEFGDSTLTKKILEGYKKEMRSISLLPLPVSEMIVYTHGPWAWGANTPCCFEFIGISRLDSGAWEAFKAEIDREAG